MMNTTLSITLLFQALRSPKPDFLMLHILQNITSWHGQIALLEYASIKTCFTSKILSFHALKNIRAVEKSLKNMKNDIKIFHTASI